MEYITVEGINHIRAQLKSPGWELYGSPFAIHNCINQVFTKKAEVIEEIFIKAPKKVAK
jgi:hypothetical protein